MNILLQIGDKVKFTTKDFQGVHTGSITSISRQGIGMVSLIGGQIEVFNVKNQSQSTTLILEVVMRAK